MLYIVEVLAVTVTCIDVVKQVVTSQLAFAPGSNIKKLGHVLGYYVEL